MTKASQDLGCRAFGVDHRFNRHSPVAPCLMVDLATPEGQASCDFVLKREALGCVGFEPPCGTSSRARERPIKDVGGQPAPRPLRSDVFLLGLPDLEGKDLQRVLTANSIYRYCAETAAKLNKSCAWYLENLGNSLMWAIPFVEALMFLPGVFDILYHACVHGGSRPKWQRIRTDV